MTRTYSNQFDNWTAGFDIPADWQDDSWGNDTCPSFLINNGALKLWVDFADRTRREMGEDVPRFALFARVADSEDEYETIAFQCEAYEELSAYLDSLEEVVSPELESAWLAYNEEHSADLTLCEYEERIARGAI